MTRVFIVVNLWVLGFLNKALAQPTGAGNPPGSGPELINPIGCDKFGCVADRLINFLIVIAIPLTAIMVLVGGFQMLTAAGNPEKFSSGKKTLIYAAAGFVV